MRKALLTGLIFAAALFGQMPVTPRRFPQLHEIFDKQEHEQTLACQVWPWRPSVSFSFRIQGGYTAELPMKQFAGGKGRMVALLRVTPHDRDNEPAYFIQRIQLPEIPENTKARMQLAGGLYYGEGKYTVDLVITDLAHSVCRKHWEMDAHLNGKERQLKVVQEPGTVQAVEIPQWTGQTAKATGTNNAKRATIFLNVAPLRMRAQKLSIFDRALLFGTLKAILEQSPFTSVRVVAFDLARHKELFRQDQFDLDGYSQLRGALNDLSLGTIDISVLNDPKGHLDLLSRLVGEETSTDGVPASDAVIFIGPSGHRTEKLPDDFPTTAASRQRFFYFAYAPFQTASFPDLITKIVRSLAGKWYPVHTPQDLAAALQKMSRELDTSASASRQ